MLRFFRPWGNKDVDAAPAPTRRRTTSIMLGIPPEPRAQGFGRGRGDDGKLGLFSADGRAVARLLRLSVPRVVPSC